jgi:hypothetical protein
VTTRESPISTHERGLEDIIGIGAGAKHPNGKSRTGIPVPAHENRKGFGVTGEHRLYDLRVRQAFHR